LSIKAQVKLKIFLIIRPAKEQVILRGVHLSHGCHLEVNKMTIIRKCLRCGDEFEWDDTMYPFCDFCVEDLESLGLDLDEAEKYYEKKYYEKKGGV